MRGVYRNVPINREEVREADGQKNELAHHLKAPIKNSKVEVAEDALILCPLL